MTNEELIELIKKHPTRKAEYMEELYNQNRGVIYKTAKRFEGQTEVEDLMQEAYIILDRAAEAFDGSLGFRFVSFLSRSLVFDFSKYIFKKNAAVDMPYSLQYVLRRYISFKQEFYQVHGTEPTENDIMRALDISKKELDNIALAVSRLNVSSIDKPTDFDESLAIVNIIASDENMAESIEETAEEQYRKQELHKAIDRLNLDERTVICRNRLKGDSMQQIALDMGASFQYCRTLGNRAIRNLRKDSELVKAITSYDSYSDYHYSLSRFKNTHISSVEFAAIKNEEARIQWEELYQQIKAQKYAI